MARRLPPLNSLRAFEAGARHLSFTRAADELHVTQAAVSHQVKALEDHLGVRLFRRLTRRLALTEEGRALLPAVSEAFDRIAEAAERIGRDAGRSRTLTVSVTPSFGARWLVHRLGRFWREHPGIELRLHHSIQLVDFDRDDVDMAVRWGRGGWSGLAAEFLIDIDQAWVERLVGILERQKLVSKSGH
jgi:LysR family transcriptional regulator, glycine cleavage system transcriptional activator